MSEETLSATVPAKTEPNKSYFIEA